MVRPLRFSAIALIAAGLLGGSTTGYRPETPPPDRRSARIVAWVDLDFEAARRGVAKFGQLLRAQRFDDPRPVVLQFVAADVVNPAHLAAEMRRLSASKPDLIVASSVNVARSLLELHTRIPVYFVLQSDPLRDGLVPSLLSTGSLTGYTYFVPLDVKVMELVKRVFPGRGAVGVVADGVWMSGTMRSQNLTREANALGLDLQIYEMHGKADLEHLLNDARSRKVQVWYVPYSELAFDHGAELATALLQSNTPTVYARRKFLKLGGLLSVESVDDEAMQTWAKSIANILNGVPAGSIPVMRPKEIEVAVNGAALSRLDRSTRDRIAREATVFE